MSKLCYKNQFLRTFSRIQCVMNKLCPWVYRKSKCNSASKEIILFFLVSHFLWQHFSFGNFFIYPEHTFEQILYTNNKSLLLLISTCRFRYHRLEMERHKEIELRTRWRYNLAVHQLTNVCKLHHIALLPPFFGLMYTSVSSKIIYLL